MVFIGTARLYHSPTPWPTWCNQIFPGNMRFLPRSIPSKKPWIHGKTMNSCRPTENPVLLYVWRQFTNPKVGVNSPRPLVHGQTNIFYTCGGCVDYLVWWLNYLGSPRGNHKIYVMTSLEVLVLNLPSSNKYNVHNFDQSYLGQLFMSPNNAPSGTCYCFDSPYNIIWLGFESELSIF